MPIRPARLSLTPFMSAYFCEPVRIYIPAWRSESIMYFSTEKHSGARCTSSMMSGEPCSLKNSTGSCLKLNSCSGLSSVTFGMFLNLLRRSVLFPTCRGPVISTAGKAAKDFSIVFSMCLAMYITHLIFPLIWNTTPL